jgi:hypothetical protein
MLIAPIWILAFMDAVVLKLPVITILILFLGTGGAGDECKGL